MMLAGGLLAVAGCGGGTRVITKVVTTGQPTAPAKTTVAKPTPDAIAAAQTLVGSSLAANAEQSTLPVGDAVFAAAVGAAADTLTFQPQTSQPSHPSRPGSSSSGGSSTGPRKIVSGSGSGEYAVAYTDGNFQHPTGISLHISASPAQNGSVVWNVVCYEDSGGIGRLEGRDPVIALPATKNLALPAPSNYCTVSANVQLAKTGTVTISITA